ncbi:MAG: hypothetical protein ACOX0Z_03695 [Candidatus Nanosyncoccaceae bacterium]|jgi:hypothetical protein
MSLGYFSTTFNAYGIALGLVFILVLGLILVAVISRRTPRQRLDKEVYQAEWLKITNNCEVNDSNSLAMAVLSGDKLVDRAMIELGFAGKTMGERLKNSPKKFSNLDGLWSAHKLRNKLAHETGFVISSKEARQALANFRQALKDLGAI